MSSKLLIIKNEAQNQQHPFHVLGLSKLPLIMATLVGGLAISVIIKLQNVTNLSKFLVVGKGIMEPFFSTSHFDVPNLDVDVRIVQFVILILVTLWA
jgi:hypothetical protein